MFTHSTLLTLATEFAARSRGTAMSLVAFCMMGGGAIGTILGGRMVESNGFSNFYGLWGFLLLVLAGIVAMVVADPVTPLTALTVTSPAQAGVDSNRRGIL